MLAALPNMKKSRDAGANCGQHGELGTFAIGHSLECFFNVDRLTRYCGGSSLKISASSVWRI